MGYNQENYRRIREEYETKYLRAREAADDRKAEAYLAIPELREADREISNMGLQIMKASLSGDYQKTIEELKERTAAVRQAREALLVSHGYPADYTDIKYECPLCSDSGFVDVKMCTCMRKRIIEAGYEASGMAELLRTQSFDNFDLSYYLSDPTVYHRMEQILGMMKQYAETFDPATSGNLILFGGTGLGKTHLSTSVAGVVLDHGYDVFYTGAVTMLSDFEFQRFGNSMTGDAGQDTSRYFSCDLLIVDDLGTEVSNQFTASVLYNLINTRLNRKKPTIISSNLSQADFRKRYWDRITSRVLGEYTVLPFLGTDIRSQKLRK
ncbi:MAG: DNA replication protein DnaC [Ruminococcaceae bacterium]|nr:DNA replication protein DnaC [Oscillospiraceae bacterium]